MADDRDLIIGQLQGGFQAIKDHLERQDEQHAEDKRQAIAARDEKHRENLARFDAMGQRIDKIDGRVSALENKRTEEKGESKGRKAVWGTVYAVIAGAAGLFGDRAVEAVQRLFHHGG